MRSATEDLTDIMAKGTDIRSCGAFYPEYYLIVFFFKEIYGINLQSHRLSFDRYTASRQFVQWDPVFFLGGVHGGSLLLFPLKTGQNFPNLLLGDVTGVSGGQHLAGGILCIRRNSKGQGGPVDLGQADQKLNQTRRPVEADGENSPSEELLNWQEC